MRGKLTYQYVNENPRGGNFSAKWHPVKATAVVEAKLPGMSRSSVRRKNRPRGQGASKNYLRSGS